MYQLTKNLVAEILPHMSSDLRDLYMGKILLLFSQSLIQKYTVASWHHHYYTLLNKLLGLRFIQNIFHDIIFHYYLTTIRTLIFGCIKWTPYVDFTVSFLDIVLGWYFRQGMGKTFTPKTRNESVIASSFFAISPMVSSLFHQK